MASSRAKNDESIDALFGGRLQLVQSRSGYRFSLDPLLLASFALINDRDRVADLGTGNGVIPLLLADRYAGLKIVGMEMQAALAERARRNVALNEFADRVTIVEVDVRAMGEIAKPESFTAVLCNPPYRQATSGRLSPNQERQLARHQMHGGVADFVRAGAYLVPQKGRLAFVYEAERSMDLLDAMRRATVEPKRVRFVHSRHNCAASLILVEGVKGGRLGVSILAPLIIYEAANAYGPEVSALLAGDW